MANNNLANLSASLQTKLEKCERNSCIMKELFEANLLPIENASFLYSSPKEIEEIKLSKLEAMLKERLKVNSSLLILLLSNTITIPL